LESIARNPQKGYNINEIIHAQIDSIANFLFGNFKTDIKREIGQLSRGQNLTEDIPIPVLDTLNLSDISLNLSYNYNIDMELPELQAMNRKIANGIKIAGVAAAVVATAGVGMAAAPAAAGATAAGTAGAAGGLSTGAVIAADAATDALSVVAMRKIFKKEVIKKGINEISKKGIIEMGSSFNNSMNTLNLYEQQASQYIPMSSSKQTGFAGFVGMITEHTHGKPQRRRMINDFIESELQPVFKRQMTGISETIISILQEMLYSGTEVKIKQLQDGLEQLKSEKDSEKGTFKQRMKQLNEYHNFLKI